MTLVLASDQMEALAGGGLRQWGTVGLFLMWSEDVRLKLSEGLDQKKTRFVCTYLQARMYSMYL
jgi:hypothetical protein